MKKVGEGNEYDVIIIGGGATGAGTARDCAMRGLRVLLLERFDYTNGATGRNHSACARRTLFRRHRGSTYQPSVFGMLLDALQLDRGQSDRIWTER